ncbi:hypothetical protein ACFRQM_34840 [Streptomyces sp. NPDC056831]|uniref:hypothetical protein n=1 Tax=Streptomyces sp. NPDC056831 TaxID=3345954 RepID=UPI0036BB5871
MPTGLRWFAEYQPFTAVIETLRGLLMGTETGNSAIIAFARCVGMSPVGCLWARSVFGCDATRQATLLRRRPDDRRSRQPSYPVARYEG